MDSPEIVVKSSLQPDTVEEFMAEMADYLELGDYEKLNRQIDVYARLTAKALLEGDVGRAIGWAWLYSEAGKMLDELSARRKVVTRMRDELATSGKGVA